MNKTRNMKLKKPLKFVHTYVSFTLKQRLIGIWCFIFNKDIQIGGEVYGIEADVVKRVLNNYKRN